MNQWNLKISLWILAFGAVLFSWGWPIQLESVSRKPQLALETTSPDQYFSSLAKTAPTVAIYDLTTDRFIYERQASTPRPLASLTKIMTALVTREELPPATIVPITPVALLAEGDSGFLVNEEWRLEDLLDYTLVTSSNDGAVAVATAVETSQKQKFEELMNAKAAALGLENTVFRNPTGLDLSLIESGAESSARDIAKIFAYVWRYHPEILELTNRPVIIRRSQQQIIHRGENTNKFSKYLSGLLASKTGFTDLASGNLVFAVDRGLGQPLVVVILGADRDSRFVDALELNHGLFDYFTEQPAA